MQFKDYLATFPDISNLKCLEIYDEKGNLCHVIPAVEGKLGSLKLYNALALNYHYQLNAESATQGLVWFAEYSEEAIKYPGTHPNIDLLFQVINEKRKWILTPVFD